MFENIIQVQCSLGLIKFLVSENYVKQCHASAAILVSWNIPAVSLHWVQ